jgi:hypothetical protein
MKPLRPRLDSTLCITVFLFLLFQSAGVWAQPAVMTEKPEYQSYSPIEVYFYDAPGDSGDWICIVPADSRDDEPGDYKYVPDGYKEGTLYFEGKPPGRYEVRAYYHYRKKGYVVTARQEFEVFGSSDKNEEDRRPRVGEEYNSIGIRKIMAAQRVLTDQGYYDGPIDGVIGDKTEDAIEKFQKDNELPATGKLNIATLKAMGI